jgi:CheY-like chemotaxis protein
VDVPLTPEQARQVSFIRKAAEDLTEIVNDLLDLAKVEAGKVVVRPSEFEVPNLFGALRGMLRPLLVSEHVQLLFDDADDLPTMRTDEGKVSQILRNFISNALKFTDQGEVRVAATLAGSGDAVVFSVADTGIGIAPEDQERIFEEFAQVDHPMQRRVQGTGLGLPLSRRLARLLGGDVSVESVPQLGSTFRVTIPLVYGMAEDAAPEPARTFLPDRDRAPVLVVENAPESLVIYDRFLRASEYQLVAARSIAEARRALAHARPVAIVLDILLDGEDAWGFLAELRNADATREIPVIVATTVDDRSKALALGADAYAMKPIDRGWLLRTLGRLGGRGRAPRALIVDDDATARYVLRQALRGSVAGVVEAEGGEDGVRLARAERPDIVFLDLVMPDLAGEVVLETLKADPTTRDIPVVIVTSRRLDAVALERLGGLAAGILDKQRVSVETVDDLVKAALAGADDASGA